MSSKKKRFYVVWKGYTPGIYESWTDCQLQIKGFGQARYKAFDSREEAEEAYAKGPFASGAPKKKALSAANREDIRWDSVSVDAACSGNPGEMEYQGVDTKTRRQIFHKKFPLGTNNIGEFLAIVHALALFRKSGQSTPVYTDSATAMSWVRQRKCKTKLKKNDRTKYLFEVIERAENWLRNNSYDNPILKWDTAQWGEIPADFGRK
jgi:ribonuclease HI